MALQKTITLPNGASGNYIRLGAYTWDRVSRECSAHLLLFTTAAQASSYPSAPLCLIAKLRLTGAKFDEYLGNSALEEATAAAQIYAAAKAETLLAGAGLTSVVLADATNV